MSGKVNELRAFRKAALLTARDVVNILKVDFPMIDKTVISKCEHSELYGVCLCRSARDLLYGKYPEAARKAKNAARGRKADRHTNTRRITIRLSDDEKLRLQQRLDASGKTARDILLAALLEEPAE